MATFIYIPLLHVSSFVNNLVHKIIGSSFTIEVFYGGHFNPGINIFKFNF